ncbi:MAG: protein kinase, partial [Planctomycetota bacterium]
MSQQFHPSHADLHAFSLGEMDDDQADVIDQHISECETCCETIAGLSSEDTFVGLLRDARQVVQGPDDTRAEAALMSLAGAQGQRLKEHPRYEVVEMIGRGGMGCVYKARHRMMDRTVALKIIHRHWVQQQEVIDRFQREVKTAASLDHPNIVTAYDAEQVDDVHFLLMEHVDGIDLAKKVKDEGPLEVGAACEIIRQVAQGLHYAHGKGMVHRDIKPHNLMLTQDNVVKILDFGLASLTPQAVGDSSRDNHESALTTAGSIMGTPDYISPEQAVDASSVDGRSDIYSLGMTLYFLLAGRAPFATGSATEKLKQHADADPVSLAELRSDVPHALLDVIARMTAKDPATRFETPAEVAAALGTIRTASPSTSLRNPSKRVSQGPVRRIAIGLAVAIAFVFTSWLAYTLFVGETVGDKLAKMKAPAEISGTLKDQVSVVLYTVGKESIGGDQPAVVCDIGDSRLVLFGQDLATIGNFVQTGQVQVDGENAVKHSVSWNERPLFASRYEKGSSECELLDFRFTVTDQFVRFADNGFRWNDPKSSGLLMIVETQTGRSTIQAMKPRSQRVTLPGMTPAKKVVQHDSGPDDQTNAELQHDSVRTRMQLHVAARQLNAAKRELEASQTKLSYAKRVVEALNEQIDTYRNVKIEIAAIGDAEVASAKAKLEAERRNLASLETWERTLRVQMERQRRLLDEGIFSQGRFQEIERKHGRSVAHVNQAKPLVEAAIKNLEANRQKRDSNAQRAESDIAYSLALLQKAKADADKAESETTKAKNELAKAERLLTETETPAGGDDAKTPAEPAANDGALHPEAVSWEKVAKNFEASGQHKNAVAAWLKAYRIDARLISRDQLPLFRRTNSLVGLANALHEEHLQGLPTGHDLVFILRAILETPEAREAGYELMKRSWLASESLHVELLNELPEEVWQSVPDKAFFLRTKFIPGDVGAVGAGWEGMVFIAFDGSNGISELQTLAKLLEDEKTRRAVLQEVQPLVRANPRWQSGIAFLAVLKAYDGKVEEAAELLTPFLSDPKDESIPPRTAWLLADVLEGKGFELGPVVQGLYERSLLNHDETIPLRNSPIVPLAMLYAKKGMKAKARDLLYRLGAKRYHRDSGILCLDGMEAGNANRCNECHREDRNLLDTVLMANKLVEIDYPVDAWLALSRIDDSFGNALSSDDEWTQSQAPKDLIARFDAYRELFRVTRKQATQKITAEVLAEAVDEGALAKMTQIQSPRKLFTTASPVGFPRIDLMLSVRGEGGEPKLFSPVIDLLRMVVGEATPKELDRLDW